MKFWLLHWQCDGLVMSEWWPTECIGIDDVRCSLLLCYHGCRCSWRGLLGYLAGHILSISLLHHLSIPEVSILATNSFAQLLKTLSPYLKAFRVVDLALVVAEEDESLQSGYRVNFLMYAPEDVVEERLKFRRDTVA